MPIYPIGNTLEFPPVEGAEEGIVALGGDLSIARLKLAYSKGIFPWYNQDEPIIWWSPDPRFVLFPDKLRISKSMRQVINKGEFSVTFNQAFERVISECKNITRPHQDGTWITPEMKEAYIDLHKIGMAHSVEVWKDDNLVGGLYGVQHGKVFSGESMFALEPNASKFGFIKFVQKFEEEGGLLIDCQVYTQHLESLGAEDISRDQFIQFLSR